MKPFILILVLLTSGCAYNGGANTWYPGQPIPYKMGPAWAPQSMPGQSRVVVNGEVFTVYQVK